MPTPRKEAMLADIQDRMSRASIAISADYRGLTVAQITELRRALRPTGAEVKVVKNTLASMAAKAAGRENMAEILQGPTALAIGYDDPIAPVKAFTEHLRARRHPSATRKPALGKQCSQLLLSSVLPSHTTVSNCRDNYDIVKFTRRVNWLTLSRRPSSRCWSPELVWDCPLVDPFSLSHQELLESRTCSGLPTG